MHSEGVMGFKRDRVYLGQTGCFQNGSYEKIVLECWELG
jgi:hypothetical protein